MPGIVALLNGFPETGAVLRQLAEALLWSPSSSLSPFERETLAAVVSRRNRCGFCHRSHRAAALAHATSEEERAAVDHACAGRATHSLRLDAAAELGRLVCESAELSPAAVGAARLAGLDDRAIHDAVLIAAAFCMFNRYVTALNPKEASEAEYEEMGQRMAAQGYVRRS